MSKRKKYRFRCPICGLLTWESRLENRYPLELVDVKSSGRGLIKNIFFDWDAQNPLRSVFKRHFYEVLEYLLRRRYIDAITVKKLADVYVKAPEVFHPETVFNSDVVYEPEVIFNPKIVE